MQKNTETGATTTTTPDEMMVQKYRDDSKLDAGEIEERYNNSLVLSTNKNVSFYCGLTRKLF